MAKFAFCFPYHGVGGVPVLFARIARRLAELGHEVAVIDYQDGAMAQAVEGSSVALIPYFNDRPVRLAGDLTVVFQSLNPWAMFPSLRFDGGTRIFFWNCHPFNLVPTLPGLRKLMMTNVTAAKLILRTLLCHYRSVAMRLVVFLRARNALVFMDQPNIETTQSYLGLKLLEPDYLPVCGGEVAPRIGRPTRDWRKEGLRLAWIGRVSDFKYPILKATLEALDLRYGAIGAPIEFSIVGSGEHLDDLTRDIAALKRLKVHVVGEVPLAELAIWLRDRTDVLFAMGSSALEGAQIGVPTILLDVAYGPVPAGYVFTWLHERSGYTLGDVVSERHFEKGNASLVARLTEAMTGYDDVSRRAYDYCAATHSLSAVTAKFLDLVALSNCFYRDYSAAGFSARDPVYEIFSAMRERFA